MVVRKTSRYEFWRTNKKCFISRKIRLNHEEIKHTLKITVDGKNFEIPKTVRKRVTYLQLFPFYIFAVDNNFLHHLKWEDRVWATDRASVCWRSLFCETGSALCVLYICYVVWQNWFWVKWPNGLVTSKQHYLIQVCIFTV